MSQVTPSSSVPKRKRKKKKRDPNRPKRAMTPFLFFACEQRKILKEKGKKMTLPEQSRHIAEIWKSVTDKSAYTVLSEVDRSRYYREMEAYKPPYKIKRPRSSYAFYMRDVRATVAAQFPDKTPRELMSDVAVSWKASSDAIKQKYVQMANDDKVRYANEKSAAPIIE
jgi:hypothetical protein|tara:strand:- start:1139 stop:1642 length:504 start_codon:yes stop_codon:yes gene_type:complete